MNRLKKAFIKHKFAKAFKSSVKVSPRENRRKSVRHSVSVPLFNSGCDFDVLGHEVQQKAHSSDETRDILSHRYTPSTAIDKLIVDTLKQELGIAAASSERNSLAFPSDASSKSLSEHPNNELLAEVLDQFPDPPSTAFTTPDNTARMSPTGSWRPHDFYTSDEYLPVNDVPVEFLYDQINRAMSATSGKHSSTKEQSADIRSSQIYRSSNAASLDRSLSNASNVTLSGRHPIVMRSDSGASFSRPTAHAYYHQHDTSNASSTFSQISCSSSATEYRRRNLSTKSLGHDVAIRRGPLSRRPHIRRAVETFTPSHDIHYGYSTSGYPQDGYAV